MHDDHQNGVVTPNGAPIGPPAKDIPPSDLLPIPGALTVKVLRNQRVTPASHWQDVRQLCLATPRPVDYQPGDVLTVFPKNFPQDVADFLSLMGWDDVADVPIQFEPTEPSAADAHHPIDQPPPPPPPPVPYLPTPPRLTLRSLLTHHLDINAVPRRAFFAFAAHFASAAPAQRERLLEFTRPELRDELYDYTTRPRRSLREVLQEFDGVRVPWRWAAALVPPLKGRQFSIASGGPLKRCMGMGMGMGGEAHREAKQQPQQEMEARQELKEKEEEEEARQEEEEKEEEEAGTRFDLLVAIVKYRTVIRRVRHGVCSRYLAALPEGTPIRVLLRRGAGGLSAAAAEAEAARPAVMVAPGTGVAPMRAMIWERLGWLRQARALRRAAATACSEDNNNSSGSNSSSISNGNGHASSPPVSSSSSSPPPPPLLLDQPGHDGHDGHERGPKTVLFFGGRNRAADFFFRDEWQLVRAEMDLEVHTAFSRDQVRIIVYIFH